MKQLLKELGFEQLPMMTTFIWDLHEAEDDDDRFSNEVVNYRNFITQPLTKGMFIPCGKDGEVLVEPTYQNNNLQYYGSQLDEYNKALKKVLFNCNYQWTQIQNVWTCSVTISDKVVAVYRLGSNEVTFLFKTIEQAINQGVQLTLK